MWLRWLQESLRDAGLSGPIYLSITNAFTS